jgi:hypothetical protein
MLGPQTVRLKPAPALPHPHPQLLAQGRAGGAFHQLAAGSAGQLQRAARLSEADPGLLGRGGPGRGDDGLQPLRFLPGSDGGEGPFAYEPKLAVELTPFLRKDAATPAFEAFLKTVDLTPRPSIEFLVALNLRVNRAVRYIIRLEHGVQSPEETLTLGSGSCRDSAWLLVQASGTSASPPASCRGT